MKNYRFMRKTDLLCLCNTFKDLKSGMRFHINREDSSYSFLDSVHFRTVAMGKYQYLDGTYILCSEDVMHQIYK